MFIKESDYPWGFFVLFFFFPVVKVILCKIAFELNYSLILGQQPVFTFQLSQLKIWETDQPSIPLLPYIIWCFGNDDEGNLDISWMNQQIHKLKALLAICNGVFSLPFKTVLTNLRCCFYLKRGGQRKGGEKIKPLFSFEEIFA